MEIQKRLSACCQRFFCCKKSDQTDAGGKWSKDQPDTVIVNPGADETTKPSPHANRILPDPPGSRTSSTVLYIAQYDYAARTDEDLSFNTGDKLEALDKSTGDWWYAKALTGVSASKKGYIPANYVAPLESIDAEP